MQTEIYADGIGEITVTGSVLRIDLVSLSATERDAAGAPKAAFRQRIIMPIEGFANASDLIQKVMQGLIEAGAIQRRASEAAAPAVVPDRAPAPPSPNGAPHRNTSPNFA